MRLKIFCRRNRFKNAMEAQMTAEREKRAEIARSEGVRQSTINRAEGDRQDAILRSEGEKQRRINEAEGQAQEILAIAQATAEGLNTIAKQLQMPGGPGAANLRVAEQYVNEFGKLAKASNTLIIPRQRCRHSRYGNNGHDSIPKD